jgi:DNA-directed RNA polymerase alpha subunit
MQVVESPKVTDLRFRIIKLRGFMMKKIIAKKKGPRPDEQSSDLPKLSQPALRALAAAGVQRLEQLTKFSENEVKRWHGIGPNAINELRRALHEKGLSFVGEVEKR